MLLGKFYFQINNYPESKKCFQQVVAQSRKQGDKAFLAYVLLNQASYQYDLDPEKEKILKEAESLYASLGFTPYGDTFIEADIVHQAMALDSR